MRYSQSLIPTRRDAPADAEIISHKLMVRAGLIQKLSSGIYTYLPLGFRVIQKIEQIIREEMNAAGAQELMLPIVMPADLWLETGRWNVYGKELLRFKDRKDNDFCIGPTHEEAITDLVRSNVKSYRQLPLNLYQIKTKFRDEIRPRFGLMRSREFIMKDGYSFDVGEEAAHKTYEAMYEAYKKIFSRCGLEFRPVEAVTGTIGGTLSHEFQVLAESGEDEIFSCNQCDYTANKERAEYCVSKKNEPIKKSEGKGGKYRKVKTPDKQSVEDVSEFLKVKPNQLIKTLIFESEKGPIAGLVRGDQGLNTFLLRRAVGANEIQMASEETIEETTGGPLGFSGPIGLVKTDLPLYVDPTVMEMTSAVVGANEKDAHFVDVVPRVDFQPKAIVPLRQAIIGDGCPRCEGQLNSFRGIEVGQVFYLGDKYSKAMKATYLNEQGKEQVMIMGCYGIGVGRTAAAAIEQHYDEHGIIWPRSIAPYEVILLSLNMSDLEVARISEQLYKRFCDKGIDVLWDDRYESPGVKFKDADLIGFPFQVIVGSRNLKNKQVEIKNRGTGEKEIVELETIEAEIMRRLKQCAVKDSL